MLLLNLSISDLISVLSIPPLESLKTNRSVTEAVSKTLYSASILFTCSMTLDRYLKVEYCLRYHSIATRKRLVLLIASIWGASIAISGVSSLADEIGEFHGVWVYRVFCIACAFVLIFSSNWVDRVRNRHLSAIRRMNRYFGVHGEKLNLLQSMSRCIGEVMRLNIVTAVLILAASLTNLCKLYYRSILHAFIGCTVAYIMSNPVVYIIVMVDLRNHYAKSIKRFQNRFRQLDSMVNPEQVADITRQK